MKQQQQQPITISDSNEELLLRHDTSFISDGKSTVHTRNLLVRGSNLNRGFRPAELLSFGRYSLVTLNLSFICMVATLKAGLREDLH